MDFDRQRHLVKSIVFGGSPYFSSLFWTVQVHSLITPQEWLVIRSVIHCWMTLKPLNYRSTHKNVRLNPLSPDGTFWAQYWIREKCGYAREWRDSVTGRSLTRGFSPFLPYRFWRKSLCSESWENYGPRKGNLNPGSMGGVQQWFAQAPLPVVRDYL
jgi:hypothetical protein